MDHVKLFLPAVILCFVLSFLLLGGCERKPNDTITYSSSVTELKENLPNFNCFSIESCQYEVLVTSRGRLELPSPSDIMIEAKGKFRISNQEEKRVRSKNTWNPIELDEIPQSLLEILPKNEYLTSPEINDSFKTNDSYPLGIVVIPIRDESGFVYFLARDEDHNF